MCGRYVSVRTPEQLAEHFGATEVRAEDQGERYNVAPTLDVYAVIERDGRRRLGTLRWGFVPFWAKQRKGAPSPINARIESIDGRMFKRAFERRRCLIPADGFYEWKPLDEGKRKQPYLFQDPEDRPLALAGVWTVWRDPSQDEDADPLYSCAIVTTEARGTMTDVHDRMPVVLPPRLWSDWLTASAEDAPHLKAAITAMEPPALRATTVTDRVNDVRNEGPELLEPGTV